MATSTKLQKKGVWKEAQAVEIYNEDEVVIQNHNLNKLHTGKMFATSVNIDVNSSTPIYLKGFSENEVHLLQRRINVRTTGNKLDFKINLFEGGTDTSATNKLNVFNVNRMYSHTDSDSNFEIYTNVTGVDLTNAIELPFSNSGLSDKKYSTEAISNTEYILKKNTNYYLKIENLDGGVLSVDFFWEWYTESNS